MKRLFSIGLSVIACCLASPMFAAEVTVTDAAGFQAALTAAQNNGQPDTITLQPGHYSTSAIGNASFQYTAASGENQPLTIQGGGADNTFIEGTGLGGDPGSLLNIDTEANNANADGNANITLKDVTLQISANLGANFSTNLPQVSVESCDFSDIQGSYALGTSNTDGGKFTVRNSTFKDMISSAIQFQGVNAGGTVLIENNQFSNIRNSSFISFDPGTYTLRQNIVHGHPAGQSFVFGVFTTGSVTLERNTILNHVHSSIGSGGAIWIGANGPIRVTGNLIAGNKVTTASSDGGGVALGGLDEVTVTNNTITGNSTTRNGGGLFIQQTTLGKPINIYNNIVFGNTTGLQGDDIFLSDSAGGVTGVPDFVFNNDFADFYSTCQNTVACAADVNGIAPTDTNLHEDPQFSNAAAGDFNLLPTSPAIAAGSASAPALPTVDLNGTPLSDPPDLGAIVAASGLTLNPPSLNFGDVQVGDSLVKSLTVTNNGGELQVSDVVLSDTQNYSVNFDAGASPCLSATFVLDNGKSCTLEVTFNPSSKGSFNATLTFASNDPDSPQTVLNLSGSSGQSGGGGGGGGCSIRGSEAHPSARGGIALVTAALAGCYALRRNRSRHESDT